MSPLAVEQVRRDDAGIEWLVLDLGADRAKLELLDDETRRRTNIYAYERRETVEKWEVVNAG